MGKNQGVERGIGLATCDILERVAQEQNPAARVWRGGGIPVEQQGIKILGTPLGHPAHVQRFLNSISEEHQTLRRRIPLVSDVQAVWLLLVHCVGARAISHCDVLIRRRWNHATQQLLPRWWNIWRTPALHACKQLPRLQGTSLELVGSSLCHGVS